jgi:RNA polymerase-binding transcription factor DksA
MVSGRQTLFLRVGTGVAAPCRTGEHLMHAHLDDAQLDTIRTLLDERERTLREEVRAMKEAAAERPSALGRQAEDMGDDAEERFRTGMEHVDLQRDQEELRDIAQARERIADGSYGSCVDCGRDIPFERLKAQPSTKRCVTCQAAFEKKHQTTPRLSV